MINIINRLDGIRGNPCVRPNQGDYKDRPYKKQYIYSLKARPNGANSKRREEYKDAIFQHSRPC